MTVPANVLYGFDTDTAFGSIGEPFTLVDSFPDGQTNVRVANGRVEANYVTGTGTSYEFNTVELGPGTIQIDWFVPSSTSDFWSFFEIEDWCRTFLPDGDHIDGFLYVYSNGSSVGYSGWTMAGSNLALTRGTWYRIKYSLLGTFEGIKFWPRDDDEPDDWTASADNTGNGTAALPALTPKFTIGTGAVSPAGYADNFVHWSGIQTMSPPLPSTDGAVASTPAPLPVAFQILYDGEDITEHCSIKESYFTGRAGGVTPGDCVIVFRDLRQQYRFVPGKTLELYIEGRREWDGYLIKRSYNYWFETHTANCEPCPHVTPRKLLLYGADRNILYTRRVLYNKADPNQYVENIYPAGTTDRTALLASFADFLEDIDGLDLDTGIEAVGSPDPYVEFRLPGPTSEFGDLMTQTAQSTGAVHYIDPDRKVIYTDVNAPDAPYGISDRPRTGEVGCRDLELLTDASQMINDAMIWGMGQGSAGVTFGRVTNTASVQSHGRWQNTGGVRSNLWKQESVDRVANSIVYGSPSSKRGHKDDRVSVRCTVFTPGFRVAQKVPVRLAVHPFTDVIPIREMTIRFASPTHAIYELTLSHEYDEPWTTNEFWYPPREDPPEGPPPRRDCTYPLAEIDTLVAVSAPSASVVNANLPGLAPTHWSILGAQQDWRNYIVTGDNFVMYDSYFQGVRRPANFETCSWTDGWTANSGYNSEVEWQYFYNDEWEYDAGGPADLTQAGGLRTSWKTLWDRHTTPFNTRWPGSGVTVKVEGTITCTSTESDRQLWGNFLGFHWETVDNTGPWKYNMAISMAKPECNPANLGAGQGTMFGGTIYGGSTHAFSISFGLGEMTGFHLAPIIEDPEPHMDIVHNVRIGADYTVTYTLNKPAGHGLIGPDGPLEEGVCYPVPQWGSVNNAPIRQLTDTLYMTASPYVAGSTKIYVDGIHQRLGIDYFEEDPSAGRIRFATAPTGTVSGSWEATGVYVPALPSTSTALFINPAPGYPITGYFGPQIGGPWNGAYYHGVWYPSFHNGVDFGTPTGTPIYAAAAGQVVYETQTAGGTMIHIYHPFHGMRTTYAHLSGRVVPNYSQVSQGQLIAYSGDSGAVTGAHLHFGLVVFGGPEDPLPYTVL